MKRSECGRGLFCTRDSGGKHEMTPGQYVAWASGEAGKRGIRFSGTPELIGRMIRESLSAAGDIFLDYDVSGNLLSRPGLDALIAEIQADPEVSHVFIPRRDRLARPENPLDGLALETRIRSLGVTLIYMDRELEPITTGKRQSIEDLIVGIVDYDRAGRDRRELAEKLIHAQIALARNGFSTGGRAPYAFDRWLARVDTDGVHPVRRLQDGERVRQQGHHVVWLPATDERWGIALSIREMLASMPAARVAAKLTADGVPCPDAGRLRTDGGVRHHVSGAWHATTVTNIGRNPLFAGMTCAGRRSMGDQLRFTPDGPRLLENADYRPDSKPKVVQNPDERTIKSKAHFDPSTSLEAHLKLQTILDERGTSQRGKPRSRDPNHNPLGSRVHDLNCSWPMYRVRCGNSFQYKCGKYMQTNGQECTHNQIDGRIAVQFVLSCLRQKLLFPRLRTKLETRLREIAANESLGQGLDRDRQNLEVEVRRLQGEREVIQRNLARAKNDGQFDSISTELEKADKGIAAASARLAALSAKSAPLSVDAEIARAMDAMDRLPNLASDATNLPAITRAFALVNVRLYLSFKQVKHGKRTLNKVGRGLLTFGDVPPPVPLYTGPTGRRALASQDTATVAANAGGQESLLRQLADREGNSLRNVNRGDTTRAELFRDAIRGLDASIYAMLRHAMELLRPNQ